MDLRPVSISRRTTPKLNASPLAAPRAIFILVDHGSGRDPSFCCGWQKKISLYFSHV
ncbi:unnamed protein product [Spirodela intermedia]|uniref:Uncharacterized protein n=1 Tax=Spirodela intermedia TaxID=51605 RepID=A0A7I8LG62_SPIIN|nr:unnamed protein product [Spirodela intermedia]